MIITQPPNRLSHSRSSSFRARADQGNVQDSLLEIPTNRATASRNAVRNRGTARQAYNSVVKGPPGGAVTGLANSSARGGCVLRFAKAIPPLGGPKWPFF